MTFSLNIRPMAIKFFSLAMALQLIVEGQTDQNSGAVPPSYLQLDSHTPTFPPPSPSPFTQPGQSPATPPGPSPFTQPGQPSATPPGPSPFTKPPAIKDITPNNSGIIQAPALPGQPGLPQQLPIPMNASSDNAIEDVINKQLADLRDLDVSKAYYAYMAADFQKAFSVDVFKAFIRQSPTLFRNKSFTVDSLNFHDVVAHVKGKLTSTDGQIARVQYDLVQEEGAWKIRKIDITPVYQPPPSNRKLSRPQPN